MSAASLTVGEENKDTHTFKGARVTDAALLTSFSAKLVLN